MINIEAPNTYQAERKYIFSVIFAEFLGLEININFTDRQNISIQLDGDRQIVIPDGLFATPSADWLEVSSLPQQPLKNWDLSSTNLTALTVKSQIPIVYGADPARADFFAQSQNQIELGIDIFGSAFFMLTRYEEVVKPERDRVDRFPVTASLAYQEDFLDRPIVNEYVEILWACLIQLAPNLQRKVREFQVVVSHDVDEPFRYAFSNISRLIKRCAGDIYKRHSLPLATKSIQQWAQVKSGSFDVDPCNTFDSIMDISEKQNIKSAFYFIVDRPAGLLDCDYSIDHPLIRDLLRKIHQRGHEIGLHTSYLTYQNPDRTKQEFDLLKRVCLEEGIEQQHWGGRQHCLRWETPTTFQNWNDAGLDYDSTLSFAEKVGFRCGVCYEFSTFNLTTRKHLNLKEKPLIVMECTVLDDRYMNLGAEETLALQCILDLKNCCKTFQGEFTLLWHNNRFTDPREVEMYKQIIH
ncbi:polysaccharide deacetylase family protein [Chamaesiphon sp. VAR_48_metabat_135_sub]|uniref:polysaccharide deacetylase family protein n=1 Tax=Chamaesiphon sp. VAR_48_metabat_135_sub TaxID=2964699 RepID=UPI00286D3E4D|nr:polysaccharide deacetylase family protein [Chamaesiphon sp. VAR_48_metabat_135_sub]